MPIPQYKQITLNWPMKGLHETCGVDAQPEGTSPLLLNVRGYDYIAKRDRGAQRPGHVKWVPAETDIVPIDAMCAAVVDGSFVAVGPDPGRIYSYAWATPAVTLASDVGSTFTVVNLNTEDPHPELLTFNVSDSRLGVTGASLITGGTAVSVGFIQSLNICNNSPPEDPITITANSGTISSDTLTLSYPAYAGLQGGGGFTPLLGSLTLTFSPGGTFATAAGCTANSFTALSITGGQLSVIGGPPSSYPFTLGGLTLPITGNLHHSNGAGALPTITVPAWMSIGAITGGCYTNFAGGRPISFTITVPANPSTTSARTGAIIITDASSATYTWNVTQAAASSVP